MKYKAPKIITAPQKKLIGLNQQMSMTQNKTGMLWKALQSRVHEIKNQISKERISLQIYPKHYFDQFNPNEKFIKWALVEVSNFDDIPKDMEAFVLEEGLYAVFHYQGSSNVQGIFQYIYGAWIPQSEYSIDQRPHFEVLGEAYKNNDPTSEELIYIPIKKKIVKENL